MSTPILNVGQLCARLNDELVARENELLTGTPQDKTEDLVQAVEQPAVLEQNKNQLVNTALQPGGTDGVMLGCQEANAFLTGFANAHHRRYLPRVLQWKRAHERTLRAGLATGVLGRQLQGIGEKADSVFVLQVSGKPTGAA